METIRTLLTATTRDLVTAYRAVGYEYKTPCARVLLSVGPVQYARDMAGWVRRWYC